MDVQQGVARAAISIVVTRADGTVEDLGVVAYHDRDPEARQRVEGAIARGERVDELDVIPHGEMTPAGLTFSGQAVQEVN